MYSSLYYAFGTQSTILRDAFFIFLNNIQILTLAVMTVVNGGTQEKRSATPWDAALAALAQDHAAWQAPDQGNSRSLGTDVLENWQLKHLVR